MSTDGLRPQQEEWDLYQSDPRALFTNIDSGVRKSNISCQYFVQNLPKICKYWVNGDPGHCSYGEEDSGSPEVTGGDLPSGFGATSPTASGTCDFLGRRSWCDKYSEEEEAGESNKEWVCCAPDPYRTGLTKLVNADPVALDLTLRPVLKSEILGYCPDEETGVGRCDGEGCGRGCEASGDLADLVKLPIVCPYYKPWRMGFGFIEPQAYGDAIREYGAYYEDAYAKFVKDRRLGKRLPLSFAVYNMRAKLQTCMWWDGPPAQFVPKVIDGENDSIVLNDTTNRCTCPNTASDDYSYPKDFDAPAQQWLLRDVWAEANTVICNGAKPECPSYTGKWDYCVDSKMYPGMKITAYQVLELRFYTYQWKSQEQYTKFFEDRPNWTDPTTADIYTFVSWSKIGLLSSDSIALGKRFRMLISPNSCEIPDYTFDEGALEISNIVYPSYAKSVGTSVGDQPFYPTLVRGLWGVFNRLIVIYPYRSSSSAPCFFLSNSLNYCFITSVGYTEPLAKVYFINSGFVAASNPYLLNPYYECVIDIPPEDLAHFYEVTKVYLKLCEDNSPNYTVISTTNNRGVFINRLLRIEYNQLNTLYVVTECLDGTYIFEKRYIFPILCGGIVNQIEFNWEASGDVTLPSRFSPKASVAFKTQFIGPTKSRAPLLFLINSHKNLEGLDLYSYKMSKFKVTGFLCSLWCIIGTSNYIWIEIDDTNLNYVLKWGITSINIRIVTYTDDSYNLEADLIYPTEEIITDAYIDGAVSSFFKINSGVAPSFERVALPPNAAIIRPKEDQVGGTLGLYNVKELTIVIDYWYLSLVTKGTLVGDEDYFPENYLLYEPTAVLDIREDPKESDSEGDSGAGEEADEEPDLTELVWEISGISNDTVGIMALFYADNGRIVSAFATKLYTNAQELFCRSIEIYYKYKSLAKSYELMPTLGSFANREGPNQRPIGVREHMEIPPCGDHECSYPCIGPMWFPYKKCSLVNWYKLATGPGFCYMPYNGEGASSYPFLGGVVFRPDYRYCLTKHYEAWSGISTALTACRVAWELFWSKKEGGDYFAGDAHIVSWVSEIDFLENSWTMPPFGNHNRDFFYRYMSVDQAQYKYTNPLTGYTTVQAGRSPYVIDNTSFYFSLNCFDTFSETDGLDCFSYINQMNFLLCSGIEETISLETYEDPETKEKIEIPKRYKWEDLFIIKGIADSYYPKPVLYMNETPTTYHYTFTEGKFAWAWPEVWRDIDRAYIATETEVAMTPPQKIDFVKILKPAYKYDSTKKQHRIICEEGEYLLHYAGPEYEEGMVTKLPGFTLLKAGETEGCTRYFELLYDNISFYDQTKIEWNDEGTGESMGSSQDNIYGATNGADWLHSEEFLEYQDMLFATDEATTVASEERTCSIYSSEYLDLQDIYYNRGVIVSMLKVDLLRLPIEEEEEPFEIIVNEEEDAEESTTIYGAEAGLFSTKTEEYLLSIRLYGSGNGACVHKILIKGRFGVHSVYESNSKLSTDIYISKPGVSFFYTSVNGNDFSFTNTAPASPMSSTSSSAERNGLVEYTIEYIVPVSPISIIVERVELGYIAFSAVVGEGIIVDSVILYSAEYSKSMEEPIYIFEQRFIASEFNSSSNSSNVHIDGLLSSRDGFGPIVPAYVEDSLSSVNKLRGYGSSEQFQYDIIHYGKKLPIDITIDNLYEVEYDMQKQIYEDTCEYDILGNEIYYKFILPSVLDSIRDIIIPIDMKVSSVKMTWDTLNIANDYKSYSFWSPGGHYWKWSDGFTLQKCYFIGTATEKIYIQQLVCVLHAGNATSNAYSGEFAYFNGPAIYQNLVDLFTGWY